MTGWLEGLIAGKPGSHRETRSNVGAGHARDGVIPVDKTSAFNLFQGLGNQKRQLQRLIGIHPWVAMGVIAVRQAIFGLLVVTELVSVLLAAAWIAKAAHLY